MFQFRSFVGAILASVSIASTAPAQEYPEFVGVYLIQDGEYVQLPQFEQLDRVALSELVPITPSYSDRVRMVRHNLTNGTSFPIFAANSFDRAPALDGDFEGIFVRTRFPQDDIFVAFAVYLPDFANLEDPVEGSGGVVVRGGTGEYSFIPDVLVDTNCGYNASWFNIRPLDATSVEFVPRQNLRMDLSPTVGQCGQTNTVPVQGLIVRIARERYFFALE